MNMGMGDSEHVIKYENIEYSVTAELNLLTKTYIDLDKRGAEQCQS